MERPRPHLLKGEKPFKVAKMPAPPDLWHIQGRHAAFLATIRCSLIYKLTLSTISSNLASMDAAITRTRHEPGETEQVALVRRFTRFYTRQIGLLDEGLLRSEFTLTEARVLYELAHRDDLRAVDISRSLGIDTGYLSRILKKFEGRKLVARIPSETDARETILALTDEGRRAFEPLDRASQRQVTAMLAPLAPEQRSRLVEAMATIQRLLDDTEAECILRPLRSGDIGWITHRQGVLYAQEYGWDETFEALVAEIAGAFVRTFDPDREACWIAERRGDVVGSVFLARDSKEVAKLRLLYVEPVARGLGIGGRLVEECVRFARNKGYRSITLWTNDVLASARRIYEAADFKLVREESHRSFGKDLVGQYWELSL
jgi:DNA-binding MarR family transcriptional regulator/GNAT superfamily N-acetyltransferase